ncbi:hypothetical protein F4604DRAFT_1926394 [Suillus subluteus]|nr:hypothetical protein F4604DRAFT_1926394 [Suillus subluteus]
MKKWNHICPMLMEALQVVKFLLKKEQLNFTKGWAASQKEMEFQILLNESDSDNEHPDICSMTGDSHVHDALLKAIADLDTGMQPLDGGLELWRRYFQSVCPTNRQVLVNVQSATLAVLKQRDVHALDLWPDSQQSIKEFLQGHFHHARPLAEG